MMGAAIGSSPAGKDLYVALDRWLYRVPGGLVISNLGACALFAALTGSSPATCAAIGKMGIPEMRKRGYPDAVATGSICAGGTLGILIPPSITFILYGHRHRDLDRTPVPRRGDAGAPAHRPLHGVDAVLHLEKRVSRLRGRLPLFLDGEVRGDPQDRAVPHDRHRRHVRALRRRGDAVGSRRRRRGAVRRPGDRHLPHVESARLVGHSCVRPRANR